MPIVKKCGSCGNETELNWGMAHLNCKTNVKIQIISNVAQDKDNVLCRDCLIRSINDSYVEHQ